MQAVLPTESKRHINCGFNLFEMLLSRGVFKVLSALFSISLTNHILRVNLNNQKLFIA
jgi:hypothetical protein